MQEKSDDKQIVLLEEDLCVLETELHENYYRLGKTVYEHAERRIEEINGLVNRLVEAKIKLTKLRQERICAYCLHPNAAGSRFCGGCGKPLEQEEET